MATKGWRKCSVCLYIVTLHVVIQIQTTRAAVDIGVMEYMYARDREMLENKDREYGANTLALTKVGDVSH